MSNFDLRDILKNKLFLFLIFFFLIFFMLYVFPDAGVIMTPQAEYKESVILLEVSNAVKEHTAWNKYGNTLFKESGLLIKFDRIYNSKSIELSVDNNDDYSIILKKSAEIVCELKITDMGNPDFFGMRIVLLSVPEDISEKGYDSMQIKSVKGDGMYSLGHIKLLD